MNVHFCLLGITHDVKPSFVWSCWFNFLLSWNFLGFCSNSCFFFVAGFSGMNQDLKSNLELKSVFRIFVFVLVFVKIKAVKWMFFSFLICVLFDVKLQSSFWFNWFHNFFLLCFFLFFTWWKFNFASWLLKMPLIIFGLIFWLKHFVSLKLLGFFSAVHFALWWCLSFGYESWFKIRLKIPSGFQIPVFSLSWLKN